MRGAACRQQWRGRHPRPLCLAAPTQVQVDLLAIIGASTLLADGIITPAITVTTAIEGLESISPNLPVIPITLAIITIIFFVQRFGTESIGKSFGVFMLL